MKLNVIPVGLKREVPSIKSGFIMAAVMTAIIVADEAHDHMFQSERKTICSYHKDAARELVDYFSGEP